MLFPSFTLQECSQHLKLAVSKVVEDRHYRTGGTGLWVLEMADQPVPPSLHIWQIAGQVAPRVPSLTSAQMLDLPDRAAIDLRFLCDLLGTDTPKVFGVTQEFTQN